MKCFSLVSHWSDPLYTHAFVIWSWHPYTEFRYRLTLFPDDQAQDAWTALEKCGSQLKIRNRFKYMCLRIIRLVQTTCAFCCKRLSHTYVAHPYWWKRTSHYLGCISQACEQEWRDLKPSWGNMAQQLLLSMCKVTFKRAFPMQQLCCWLISHTRHRYSQAYLLKIIICFKMLTEWKATPGWKCYHLENSRAIILHGWSRPEGFKSRPASAQTQDHST